MTGYMGAPITSGNLLDFVYNDSFEEENLPNIFEIAESPDAVSQFETLYRSNIKALKQTNESGQTLAHVVSLEVLKWIASKSDLKELLSTLDSNGVTRLHEEVGNIGRLDNSDLEYPFDSIKDQRDYQLQNNEILKIYQSVGLHGVKTSANEDYMEMYTRITANYD